MARCVQIEFTKTYATPDNAEKAVQKILGENHAEQSSTLTYSILPVVSDSGKIRYGVLFFGERAVQQMMHFYFNVAA